MSVSSSILALVLLCLITTSKTPTAYGAEQYSLVGKWGSIGSGYGKFSQPLEVVIDSLGNVYVNDFNGLANDSTKIYK